MNDSRDPISTGRILAARQVIDDSSASPFDIYYARQALRDLGADGWQTEQDRAREIQQLRCIVADSNSSPIDIYAARERLNELGDAALLSSFACVSNAPTILPPAAKSTRNCRIIFGSEFWQIYFVCFAAGVLLMATGVGGDTGPISFGRYGEIDVGGEMVSLMDVIFGSAIIPALCCWLFKD